MALGEEHAGHALVGAVIGDKFRIDHVVGEGGMGIVVAATHLLLGERVALKFLRREAMNNPEVVARFAQEARAAARLKSPRVARVLDVGTWNDMPFMVMEYLEGRDLGSELDARGTLPVDEAAEYVIEACEGLAEAHARGIIHRDVKPENLFLTENDGWKSVKLLDFGISKAALTGIGSEISNVKTSAIMGSPCYMSPEQLRSTKSVDYRADIWSVGAVLFELLSGTTPYDSNVSLSELVVTVLEAPPRDLRALRADVPEEIERIVLRCLEKDPAKRFQSVAELAIALLPFAPRRARAAAERALSLARSAGHSHADLKLPPSIPPPSSSTPGDASGGAAPIELISGVRVASQLLHNEYRSSSPNKETGSALSSANTIPVQARPRRLWPIPVVLAAIVLAVVIGWTLRGKDTKPDASAAVTSPAPRAVATAADVTPHETAAIPPPPASAASASVGSATPEAKETVQAPQRATTQPRGTGRTATKPVTSSAPSAGTQDLDIRLTR